MDTHDSADVVESRRDPMSGGLSPRTWRIVLLVAAAVVLVATAVVAVRAAGAGSRDRQEVRSADADYREAVVIGDEAGMRRLMAPGLELVPPTGGLLTRDDYLQSIGSGDLDFRVFEPETSPVVRLSGSTAVITYRCRFEVAAEGIELEHDAWATHVYERQGDAWRLVWSHATAVDGWPPT